MLQKGSFYGLGQKYRNRPTGGCLTAAQKAYRKEWCLRHRWFNWKRVHLWIDIHTVRMPCVHAPLRSKKCWLTDDDMQEEWAQGANPKCFALSHTCTDGEG